MQLAWCVESGRRGYIVRSTGEVLSGYLQRTGPRQAGMKALRGDVVLVEFPYSAGGSAKVRPALVVQNNCLRAPFELPSSAHSPLASARDSHVCHAFAALQVV